MNSSIQPASARRHDGPRRLPTVTLLALAATTLLLSGAAQARHVDRLGLIDQTWEGIAIKGYDPVAYFEVGTAVKGSADFSHEWLGQEWRFASARHRDLFAADPIKYVPQYGGYCSETQDVASINPTAWRIVGGRLYLFFAEASAEQFVDDDVALSKAEAYWQKIKVGLPAP